MSLSPRSLESAVFSARAYMFASAACQSAIYTVSALLFFACMLKVRNRNRAEICLNIVLTIMFLIATANTVTHLQFFRLVLVEHDADPKYASVLNTPFHFWSTLLMGVSAVLADALMIWRLFIVWNRNWWIIVLPTAMTVATLGDTFLWVVDISRNDVQGYINTGFSVIPVSVATNILVTLLIAGRIVWGAHRIAGNMKTMDIGLYSWIIGILIESAALYSATGIITVATFLKGSPSEQVMISFYMIMPSVAAFLIVLRVRLGLGYENRTMDESDSSATSTNFQSEELPTTVKVHVNRTVLVSQDSYSTHSSCTGWTNEKEEEV